MKAERFSVVLTGRLYPPSQKIFLVLISVRCSVDPRAIVRPEGISQWKIPTTPSGTEPTAFRLVAQCVNKLRHCETVRWFNMWMWIKRILFTSPYLRRRQMCLEMGNILKVWFISGNTAQSGEACRTKSSVLQQAVMLCGSNFAL